MWKASQRIADLFWQKWKKDYRQYLLFSRKLNKDQEKIEIGDTVIITDSNLPRTTWPMGRAIEIYPSQDGRIRVVNVQTKTGVYKRSVPKLIKLDVIQKQM